MHKRTPSDDRNAAKQRRYRERLAKAEVLIPVRVGPRGIDLLIRLHYLPPRDSHAREQIGEAVSRMLADAAEQP
ncbi:hypothetical protein IVB33_39870 [Bradyrhizobium sp. 24]|uniref:hypothetical protein n=1 Tax=unclassified Bradyrhizobium TaxID=2631580 RepID=UPI001FFB2606|nr:MULTISPECIES: hypothetical protein [unclassified Bradyrhizobium]MCK1303894.1 hypothetical protein [Bradyrhizobium sp. 37]MCK1382489.1 hypothetical protein [Bradyrhizobium sp. 24]MCK1770412.1 hypothetical protein [Bradyrhizobium sp. 134]